MVGRAARADVVAAEHARHAHHDALEIGVGDDDAIAEDAGRGARDLIAGVADEAGDDQRRQRVEDRQAEPRADERGDDGQRRPDVAARLRRVGQQHLAAEPLRLARFVRDHREVDDDRRRASRRSWRSRSRAAADRPVRWLKALRSTSTTTSSRNTRDRRGGNGLVLAVPVGMVLVGRLPRRAHADEADDVGRGVGERVEAVGQDADRAARVAEAILATATAEVEDEHADAARAQTVGVTLSHGVGGVRMAGCGLGCRCTLESIADPLVPRILQSSTAQPVRTRAPSAPATSGAALCR